MATHSGKVATAEVAADLEAALADLAALDLDTLRSRWLKLTARPAPRAFRRKLLLRVLAYEHQVAEHGGLPAAVKRRLRQLARAAREGRFEETLGTAPLKRPQKAISKPSPSPAPSSLSRWLAPITIGSRRRLRSARSRQ